MLPTPLTSHVLYERIYEPAEDSYLLLDTLSSPSEVAFLKRRLSQRNGSAKGVHGSPVPFIVEVGTGSGVVIAFLTAHAKAIFGRDDVLTLGTDVNSYACHATQKTVVQAVEESVRDSMEQGASLIAKGTVTPAKYLGTLVADLCAPLRSGLVDLVVFNPPYVPTPDLPPLPKHAVFDDLTSVSVSARSFDRDSHLLALSYAGGVDGMETTKRLLADLPNILNWKRGVAYVLLCAQNKPDEVKNHIESWGPGWAVETVSQSGKTAGWEKLEIIRIWRVKKEGLEP
ncbi:MAG: S-adenosylmethionine-dependent methyltransferase [Pleopsidium flavum]|nr:MAG: S-adenosylmethionine-dependent methyltransferase [Pleopsidium flavum]